MKHYNVKIEYVQMHQLVINQMNNVKVGYQHVLLELMNLDV